MHQLRRIKILKSHKRFKLIEKFELFGDSEKATVLADLFQKATSIKKTTFEDFRVHDVLHLLLLLSESPLKEKYEPPSILRMERSNSEIWEEIISEDPLNGDHWNVEDEASDISTYDTDGDDGSIREPGANIFQKPLDDEHQDPDGTLYLSDGFDTSTEEDTFTLVLDAQSLQTQISTQYWRSSGRQRLPRTSWNSQLPSSLNTSIAFEQQSNPDCFYASRTPTNYVEEYKVVKECSLFCLGLPSEIFILYDNHFKPSPNLSLRHMSHESLLRLLEPIAGICTSLRNLETFTRRENAPGVISNVVGAFSENVRRRITAFKHFVSGLDEARDKPEKHPSDTLLLFLRIIRKEFTPLQLISSFLTKNRLNDVKSDIRTYLLDAIYEEILQAEYDNNLFSKDLFVDLLMDALLPCLQDFQRWYSGCSMRHTTIGLSINFDNKVSLEAIDYWKSRYIVKDGYPKVLQDVLPRIMDSIAGASISAFDSFANMQAKSIQTGGATDSQDALPTENRSDLFLFENLHMDAIAYESMLLEPQLSMESEDGVHSNHKANYKIPFRLFFWKKFVDQVDQHISLVERELMTRLARDGSLTARLEKLSRSFILRSPGTIPLCDGLAEMLKKNLPIDQHAVDKIFHKSLASGQLQAGEDIFYTFDSIPQTIKSVKVFDELQIGSSQHITVLTDHKVIRRLTDELFDKLGKQRRVDDLILLHEQFTQDIVNRCFLNSKSKSILNAVKACLDECLEFVDMCRKMDMERVEAEKVWDRLDANECLTLYVPLILRRNRSWDVLDMDPIHDAFIGKSRIGSRFFMP
ncbi:hypothetical protein HDU97_008296 [Phlyctochytrium planicorne]|nr:hypothetical protein HDU97_008296 [Phlyctochytrium planicorne]